MTLALSLNQDTLPEFEKFGRMIRPEADPTRTKTLRGMFVMEERRRHRALARVITQSIVENDALGLRAFNQQTLNPLPPGALAGLTDTEKVKRFGIWLQNQISKGILELTPSTVNPLGDPWITSFMKTAYAKGIIRGSRDVARISGLVVPVTTSTIGGVMATPAVQSGFELELNRTWTALEGISQSMQAQVISELTSGLESGLSPRQIARNINDRVDKIGLTRSEMTARTEIVRANNLGSIKEYERLSPIVGEDILSQWHATIDNRLRDNHLVRHGKVFKNSEIIQLLGEPNCRCAALPYIESIEGKRKDSSAATFTDMSKGRAATIASGKRKKFDIKKFN